MSYQLCNAVYARDGHVNCIDLTMLADFQTIASPPHHTAIAYAIAKAVGEKTREISARITMISHTMLPMETRHDDLKKIIIIPPRICVKGKGFALIWHLNGERTTVRDIV